LIKQKPWLLLVGTCTIKEQRIGEENDRSLLLPDRNPTLFTCPKVQERQVLVGGSEENQQPAVKILAQCLGAGFFQLPRNSRKEINPAPEYITSHVWNVQSLHNSKFLTKVTSQPLPN
jgi:hypothetical protein